MNYCELLLKAAEYASCPVLDLVIMTGSLRLDFKFINISLFNISTENGNRDKLIIFSIIIVII